MRKSGVAEKYKRGLQYMYERSKTEVRDFQSRGRIESMFGFGPVLVCNGNGLADE